MENLISVVIPVYNSERSLDMLCRRLDRVLCRRDGDYEIILVDDGSSDESYGEMCRLHECDKRVKAIRLKGNYGQQNAVMCGLNFSRGDCVITMDDDLQHPPEELEKLLNKLDEGYDIVYGIPDEIMYPSYRRLGVKVRDLLFERMPGKPPGIKVSSFRVMKRWLVREIIKDKSHFVYISALIFKRAVNAVNISVRYDARKYGASNYNLVKLAILFFKLFINYSLPVTLFKASKQPQFEVGEMKF